MGSSRLVSPTTTTTTTTTTTPARSADGGVEGGPRAGRGQLLRGEAVGAGQPDDAGAGHDCDRGGAAARRAQHHHRHRPRRRGAAQVGRRRGLHVLRGGAGVGGRKKGPGALLSLGAWPALRHPAGQAPLPPAGLLPPGSVLPAHPARPVGPASPCPAPGPLPAAPTHAWPRSPSPAAPPQAGACTQRLPATCAPPPWSWEESRVSRLRGRPCVCAAALCVSARLGVATPAPAAPPCCRRCPACRLPQRASPAAHPRR